MRRPIMRFAAFAVGSLLWLVAAGAAAQTPSLRTPAEAPEGARRAAQEALKTFAQLVTPRNAGELGFEEPEDVRSATVGAPLPEFLVRLDELRTYESGADPRRLFHETGLYLFPVLVREQVRSSLTIRQQQGAFAAVAFGAPAFARRASDAVARIPGAGPRAQAVQVRVPALNVFFVAYEDGGQLLFLPILDDPRFDLKAGEPVPAAKALERLVPAAKEHNGLPT